MATKDAVSAGLKEAAKVFAATMRAVAATRTARTAAAVHIVWAGGGHRVSVMAGEPGGEWGWTPIVALMFDNNLRHPFYGDRKHWYNQAYKKGGLPITYLTEEAAIEPATSAFADAAVAVLEREYGFNNR